MSRNLAESHIPVFALLNKLLRWHIVQDWVRLHGYEMHVMAAATDVRIRPGTWQKNAMIQQVSAFYLASSMCPLLGGLSCDRKHMKIQGCLYSILMMYDLA